MKKAACILAFLLTSVLCIAALFAAAFLPQSRIAGNVSRSLPGLVKEGTYPRLKEGYSSAMLDNLTDSLTLMEVLGMNAENPGAVFSNPLYLQKEDPLESLVNYAENPGLEPDGYYVRYWMGFRASLRLLFLAFDYSQIRKLMFLILAGLAALSMFSVAKNLNCASALGLGVCLLLMRPLIVARSFQFSTCFLIALAAMPLVPLIQKEKIGLGTFFLVLGMLTQYFDFYSVPALTLCLPLLYLLALRSASGERGNFGTLARAGASWLSGYVLFWLEKLLLSSLFSPIDGVENGIGEFIYWMQRKPDAGENRLAAAFKNVWSTVCPDVWAALVLLSLAALLALYALWKIRRGKLAPKRLWNGPLLCALLIPLLWMAAAATPTAQHAFFQYRSLAAVFWGLCLLVTSAAEAPRLHWPSRAGK